MLFFQQSNYKTDKYYFSAFCGRYLLTYVLFAAAAVIVNLLDKKWGYFTAAAGAAVLLILSCTIKSKGKVKYTKRALRIFITALLSSFAATFFVPCLGIVLFPMLLPLATYILFPLELLINAYYTNKAKKRIASSGAVKIGITGSYAKTSVKNILCEMLSSQYRCIATPKSYNTPLGIASFVNSFFSKGKKNKNYNELDNYQFIIFELGAKREGDITKLCKMTLPQYGILTAIDECHMETFVTLDNVAKCKRELVSYLKPCDICVLSCDSSLSSQSGGIGVCRKIYAGLGGSDVYAKDLKLSCYASEFTLCLEGEEIPCQTPLLGRHSVSNICLCAALARQLHISAENIKKSISSLCPVPHRLSIINKGDLTIIDDSYNANLKGVDALVEVLLLFDKKRIVITQGVAESGQQSERINIEAGEKLSAAADIAYIIGGNWAALKIGLLKGGMKKENIYFCKSVEQAVGQMQKYLDSPAVAAFQNDLPDCFN